MSPSPVSIQRDMYYSIFGNTTEPAVNSHPSAVATQEQVTGRGGLTIRLIMNVPNGSYINTIGYLVG